MGKDIVALELVELSGEAGAHGEGLTLQVKSSNPAMHARKRMQEAVEFALERTFGKPVECKVDVVPLKKEERTLETRRGDLEGVAAWDRIGLVEHSARGFRDRLDCVDIDAAIGIDQDPQNPAVEFDVVEFGANIGHDRSHQLTDSIDNSHGTPLSWSTGRKRRRN